MGIVNYYCIDRRAHMESKRPGRQVCVEGNNWSLTVQHTIYTVPYGLRGH